MNYKRKFCFVLALLLVSSILFMSVDTSVFATGEPVVLEEVSFTCEKNKEQLRSDFEIVPNSNVGIYSGSDFKEINNNQKLKVAECVFMFQYSDGNWYENNNDTFDEGCKYKIKLSIKCKMPEYRIGNNTKIILNGEEINCIEKDISDGTYCTFYFNEQKVPLIARRPVAKDGFARTGVVNERESLVYNGREQTAYKGGNGYTVENNKATDAGIYTAVFKLNDGYIWGNISKVFTGEIIEDYSKKDIKIKWEIKKVQGDDPAYESNKPTALKGTKGKTLSTVALPEGFEWKDPNQVLDAIGEKEFKAIYKSKNYVDKEVDLKVTVEEAPEPEPTPNPPLPPTPSPDSYDNYENNTKYHRIYERKSKRHNRIADIEEDASLDKEGEETINKDTSLKERSIILAVGSKLMTVFGKNVTNDTAPIIKNNRTMLPARFVAEALGARVTWNAKERTVYISGVNIKTNEPLEIKLTVGSKHALVNGKAYELDSPVIIENDRTYTPLRFIAEILGAEVYWDDATKVVRIIK